MPLNVKVPFLMSSSYRKAVEAKEQILDIISKRLESQNSTFLNEGSEKCHRSDDLDDDVFKVSLVLHIHGSFLFCFDHFDDFDDLDDFYDLENIENFDDFDPKII